MDTPSPEIILKNIDNFMRQWKIVEFNAILLLPSSALHEIEKLKGRVTKGCMSGFHQKEEQTEMRHYIEL